MAAITSPGSRAAQNAPVIDHSDARLRALTEYALEIITVQDDGGAFTYANEAVARQLDHGNRLEARIVRLTRHRDPWKRIELEVYLPL